MVAFAAEVRRFLRLKIDMLQFCSWGIWGQDREHGRGQVGPMDWNAKTDVSCGCYADAVGFVLWFHIRSCGRLLTGLASGFPFDRGYRLPFIYSQHSSVRSKVYRVL